MHFYRTAQFPFVFGTVKARTTTHCDETIKFEYTELRTRKRVPYNKRKNNSDKQ